MEPRASLCFDSFEVRPHDRMLLRDGKVIPLRGRAFDLLVALAERAGRLVTKDELLEVVWPGLVVEENNVAAQVAALRKALQSELILTVPGRGYRFAGRLVGPAADGDARPVDATKPAPAPLATLFGRDTALQEALAALARHACVSLVGPGGVGKTTLARAAASAWQAQAADGATRCRWMDLAPLSRPDPLLPALCRAIGVDSSESDIPSAASAALGERPTLLVVDNAEHLIDGVADLVGWLTSAVPGLRILVTTQAPLAIAAEHIERVDPLALPDPHAGDAQALESAALAMLVDRISAADPRYRLPPESVPLARKLCADLDGLPLAIEMAAARVPLIGLQGVRDALQERFSLLRSSRRDVAGRHRSLLTALDWSHDLLAPDEQRLFHGLAVFADGFSLDLAVEVAGDPADDRWDTIDRIAVLVDHSLVFGDHAEPPRYRLLETMRQYAMTRLQRSGREAEVRARQGAALFALLLRAGTAPKNAAGAPARALAVAEMRNVREAQSWCLKHEPETAVKLAIGAASVATFTTWRRDASDWLADCEPVLGALPAALRAWWWTTHATQSYFRSSPQAIDIARKAVDQCREAGEHERLGSALIVQTRATLLMAPAQDMSALAAELTGLVRAHPEWKPEVRAAALGTMGMLSDHRGELALSLQQHLEELELATAAGLDATIDGSVHAITDLLARLGRHDEALTRLRARLAEAGTRDSFNVLNLRMGVVDVLLRAGRPEEALAEARLPLEASRRHGAVDMADIAALIAAQRGRPRAAALLLGHADARLAATGSRRLATTETAYARCMERLRSALPQTELERLLQRGAGLDEHAADELLYGAGDAPPSA